uniref:Putative odorant receptor or1 n=1 Tax=Anopheles darlingi TaxID=43151 RepID=A0A158N7M2_ANODA
MWKLPTPQWNAFDRRDSFRLQLFCLKWVGLWPPEDADQATRRRHTAYGWVLRIVFMYLCTFTQALYFKDVNDLNDVCFAMYVLLTQLTLIYKLERFNNNIPRIQQCLRKLNCALYHPKKPDEFEPVLRSMSDVFWLMIFLTLAAYPCVFMFMVVPAFVNDRRLPLPAWFPFNIHESRLTYTLLYLYQSVGVFFSATCNVSTDTMFSGLILHARGQFGRLGCMLKQVGKSDAFQAGGTMMAFESDSEWDANKEEVERHSKVHGRAYSQIVECVILHKDILRFIDEAHNIFQESVFVQVCASVIIICTTLLQATGASTAALISAWLYLLIMALQVLNFCYVGNDIYHESSKLIEYLGMSDYFTFDKATGQAAVFFMHRSMYDVDLEVGNVLRITLKLNTFLQIIKMSYSYLAVLQSMA